MNEIFNYLLLVIEKIYPLLAYFPYCAFFFLLGFSFYKLYEITQNCIERAKDFLVRSLNRTQENFIQATISVDEASARISEQVDRTIDLINSMEAAVQPTAEIAQMTHQMITKISQWTKDIFDELTSKPYQFSKVSVLAFISVQRPILVSSYIFIDQSVSFVCKTSDFKNSRGPFSSQNILQPKKILLFANPKNSDSLSLKLTKEAFRITCSVLIYKSFNLLLNSSSHEEPIDEACYLLQFFVYFSFVSFIIMQSECYPLTEDHIDPLSELNRFPSLH